MSARHPLADTRDELASLRLNLRRERVDLDAYANTITDEDTAVALWVEAGRLRRADAALTRALAGLSRIITPPTDEAGE